VAAATDGETIGNMTMFSDFADEFTVQTDDAMEMYDQLRRRRHEGMYARLAAQVAASAARQPLFVLAPLIKPDRSTEPS